MSAPITHAEDCKCRQCKRIRNEPETATCDSCGRRRLCRQVMRYQAHPVTYDPYYCVAECLDMISAQREAKRKEMRDHRRIKAPPLAWPIIGGPLDGSYAVPSDFYWGGRYYEHNRDYTDWNAAHGGSRRIGGSPTMVFIHASLIRPTIRGADR